MSQAGCFLSGPPNILFAIPGRLRTAAPIAPDQPRPATLRHRSATRNSTLFDFQLRPRHRRGKVGPDPYERIKMFDPSQFDLSQDVAIVTGASGGLGWHFAKTLVAAGARVALVARRHDKLTELIGELPAGSATAIAANVAERSTIVDLVATVTRELGAPTLLVNNAGITDDQPALELTEADWHRVLDTNLTGAWELAQLCAAAWVEEKRPGNIINIASILGLRVAGRSLPYVVSKAGLIQMTKALSLEWARYQIRVNAIAPGYIETDLNRDFFASEAGAALIKRIPQRRLGKPGDLDGALLLLASQASSYITGSVITVDGGHLNSSL